MSSYGTSGTGGYNAGNAYDAANARSSANAAQRDAHHAETRVQRLSLICMAMWSLIQDKTNLTEADLFERVRMLDAMDGEQDGKASRGLQKCPACSRTMNRHQNKCLYCGAKRPATSAFDTI